MNRAAVRCQDGVIPSLSAAWATALRRAGEFTATLNSRGKRRDHPIFSSVLIVRMLHRWHRGQSRIARRLEWCGPFSFSGLLSVAGSWPTLRSTVAHAPERRRDHAIWHDPNEPRCFLGATMGQSLLFPWHGPPCRRVGYVARLLIGLGKRRNHPIFSDVLIV
jgi:hypothetical protein